MKLKKTAAMVVSAACLTVCAGMSMSASAAGVSTSLPKDILGVDSLMRVGENSSVADAYKQAVLNYADTHSCSFMYTLLDMDIDGDRVEELIITPVEPAEGRVAEIYSYVDGNAAKVGEVPMGESGNGVLFEDMTGESHTNIVVLDGEYGSRTAVWYNFDGTSVSEVNRAEEADVNFDDILELGGTVVTYNGDGTWTTVDILGETVDGIDMWLIDAIVGDEDPDDPFEFPEIPADATPVEETLIVYDAFMRYMAEYEEDDTLEDINLIEISVFDMNKDGIPELIIKDGTSEADYAYEFMTYDYNTGLLEYIDADWGGHSALFMDTATGQLCRHYGQMGSGEIVWYSYDGTELTIAKSVEDIDYNGVEDPSSVYAQYGDFVKVDSSYNYRNSAQDAWQHVVGEDVFDGFDTSVFDRYLENYNAAQAPTDTTASGTTTSAKSTTTAATTTAGKTNSPKTGDNALPMLGAVITIAGLTAFTLRKKND